MICEDGLSKRKVVMHAGNEFKFQELSDFNEVKCKAAYKVFIISTSRHIIVESNSEFCRLPQAAALLSKVRHPLRHGGSQCVHQGGVGGEGEV